MKDAGLYDVGYRDEKDNPIAPTREIMFAFMGDTKAVYLTKYDLLEQAERVIALGRELKLLIGMWDASDAPDPRLSLERMLNRLQREIANTNYETRRQRRRVAQAAEDEKLAAKVKFGRERAVDIEGEPSPAMGERT